MWAQACSASGVGPPPCTHHSLCVHTHGDRRLPGEPTRTCMVTQTCSQVMLAAKHACTQNVTLYAKGPSRRKGWKAQRSKVKAEAQRSRHWSAPPHLEHVHNIRHGCVTLALLRLLRLPRRPLGLLLMGRCGRGRARLAQQRLRSAVLLRRSWARDRWRLQHDGLHARCRSRRGAHSQRQRHTATVQTRGGGRGGWGGRQCDAPERQHLPRGRTDATWCCYLGLRPCALRWRGSGGCHMRGCASCLRRLRTAAAAAAAARAVAGGQRAEAVCAHAQVCICVRVHGACVCAYTGVYMCARAGVCKHVGMHVCMHEEKQGCARRQCFQLQHVGGHT